MFVSEEGICVITKVGEIMIITDNQIKDLMPYIDNIKEIVESDRVVDLLDALDDIIVENILGNGNEPDEVGIKLQRIYDEIYNQN